MTLDVDYSRLDNLSDPAYDQLTQIATDGLPEPWEFGSGDSLVSLFAVLVEERDACLLALSYPTERTPEPCPVEPILGETKVKWTRQTASYNDREHHQLFISTDTEAVNAVRNLDLFSDTTDAETLGHALGYPTAAVEAFCSGTGGAATLKFLQDQMDVPPEDARYVEMAPYAAAPTMESVHTAIECGKRMANLPEQIVQGRPEFRGLEEQCADPLTPTEWQQFLGIDTHES